MLVRKASFVNRLCCAALGWYFRLSSGGRRAVLRRNLAMGVRGSRWWKVEWRYRAVQISYAMWDLSSQAFRTTRICFRVESSSVLIPWSVLKVFDALATLVVNRWA